MSAEQHKEVLDKIEEVRNTLVSVSARCTRIETRVSKLLVEMGMSYNGSQVLRPDRLPEVIVDIVPNLDGVPD